MKRKLGIFSLLGLLLFIIIGCEIGNPKLQVPPVGDTGILSGIVRNQSGRPIENVRISISVNGEEKAATFTDTDGRFEFSLAPGAYTLQAVKKNYKTYEKRGIEICAGKVSREFVEMEGLVNITGRVVDNKGFPVSGVLVELVDTVRRTMSDDEGKFTFYNLVSGEYIVRAYRGNLEKPDYMGVKRIKVELSSEEPVLITVCNLQGLDEFGTIEGVIYYSGTREPIKHAFVTTVFVDSYLTVITNNQGYFRLKVPPGEYDLMYFIFDRAGLPVIDSVTDIKIKTGYLRSLPACYLDKPLEISPIHN